MGAVLVPKRGPALTGWNKLKTHPKSAHPHKYVHAEFDVLRRGLGEVDFKDAYLYVGRYTPGGRLGISRPCPSCVTWLKRFDLKGVYYAKTGAKDVSFLSFRKGIPN